MLTVNFGGEKVEHCNIRVNKEHKNLLVPLSQIPDATIQMYVSFRLQRREILQQLSLYLKIAITQMSTLNTALFMRTHLFTMHQKMDTPK